jgi:hypothetical protein
MIREGVKVDTAVYTQKGGTSANGEYFRMDTFAKAKFTAIASGQHDGDDLTFKVYEAKDATGDTPVQLGATITMAQGIKVKKATVVCTSVNVGTTLILTPYYFNGEGALTAGTAITFTAAAAQSLPNRQFLNTGDNDAATSLAACINDATYGVPGLLAAVDTATVTITCVEPGGGDRQVLPAKNGTGAFDITESVAGELVVTDLIQEADFEVYVQDLTRDSDYTHVQARLASIETDVATCVMLERAMAGYGPVGQAVAYTDTSA